MGILHTKINSRITCLKQEYQNNKDVIARLEYVSFGDRFGWNLVYFYNSTGLNFSIEHPIQTIANIETKDKYDGVKYFGAKLSKKINLLILIILVLE